MKFIVHSKLKYVLKIIIGVTQVRTLEHVYFSLKNSGIPWFIIIVIYFTIYSIKYKL